MINLKLALFTISLNLKLHFHIAELLVKKKMTVNLFVHLILIFLLLKSLIIKKKLRVLTVLNENFEVDLVSLYNEFMLSKNRNKRKYFQDNFAQSEKNRVKRKWLEKMNQLKKHILFFDFLENHYVSKDEVSKQHLNVIKKSNFVKSK